MRANGTFAVIAAFQVLTQVFQLFRYRAYDWSAGSGTFYDDWGTAGLGTNIWQYANLIYMYAKMAIFGTAMIT